MNREAFLDYIRSQIVGRNLKIQTPFGARLLHYFDWTASGRALRFLEEYLCSAVLPEYANTHTEDDATGRATTLRLHEAERVLKAAAYAGDDYHVAHCGSGTTEAIHRLMEILGIYAPPVLLERHGGVLRQDPNLPVVFIGPYEHHSNVVPWREGLCHVVEVPASEDGGIDPDVVETAVSDPRWKGRLKVGSFSSASNVTGRMTDVAEVARRLHRHGALACFDWAAAAAYEEVDVRIPGSEQGLDAVYYSPHKFVGGPGSSGVLIFHDRIYRRDLPPTFGGGGTVTFVGPHGHEFIPHVEERERPGTPGILQALRAALAVEVRDRVSAKYIREIEHCYLKKVLKRWQGHSYIEVLGDPDPDKRIGIIAFNLRHGPRHLHPRFVTRLLSDLFGIQTRAGCSCAGPYGHFLLGIDDPTSEDYRAAIHRGYEALKPGWVRVNLHYTLTPGEIDYLLECIDFVAEQGSRFLSLYECRLDTGAWVPVGWEDPPVEFGLDQALDLARQPEDGHRILEDPQLDDEAVRKEWRRKALAEARERLGELPKGNKWTLLPLDVESLSYFRATRYALSQGEFDGTDPARIPGTGRGTGPSP